ncbi:MAG: hypothetical protein MZV70_63845 [Desulfobacterales bacterium]|nr:hypothetical protein [Desulfobacterales bacterium]
MRAVSHEPSAVSGRKPLGLGCRRSLVRDMALLYGLWYSYSVFLVALLKEFGWSRSVTAGAFSVFALVHAGVGPFLRTRLQSDSARAAIILAGGCVLALGLLLAGRDVPTLAPLPERSASSPPSESASAVTCRS